MPLIRHHKDPFGLIPPFSCEVEPGTVFIEWLSENFHSDYELTGGLEADVILNGSTIFSTGQDESVLNFPLGPLDEVVIVCRPAGGLSLVARLIIAVVVAAAVTAILTPRPVRPGDSDQGKRSPNNQLQAATNDFRPGQAIPEIFGTIISYPDFVQPSAFEYVNNFKIISELFCIGVGQYDVTNIRSGETLISDIPASSATVYPPGAVIPADILNVHRGTNEVDGQTLAPPDSPDLTLQGQIESVSADGISNTTITLAAGSIAVSSLGLAAGIDIRVTAGANIFNPVILLSGDFTIVSVTTGAQDVIELNTTTGTSGLSLQSTITRLTPGGVTFNFVGWFNIPGDQAEEILFHWRMPQGIRSDTGGVLSIDIEFEIERLDATGNPTGLVFTRTVTKSGSTLDPQFDTTRFSADTDAGFLVGQYRGRLRRTTNSQPAGSADRVQVEDFVSVTPYTNPSFGDVTLLHVERQGTTFAVTASASRINAETSRRLPAYNRTTGIYETGNLVPTRNFADAVAYSIIVAGGRSVSTVDLAELYAIQDGISPGTLGFFDFSFDDFDVSLGERVVAICNAARVAPYRDGAVWRFTRDEVKPVRSALFNRRVMPTRESTQGWQLQRPDDKDSVSLTFVDPATNTERILYRRVDLNTGQILSDQPGAQPLEINLAGCRDLAQANNRIDLEIRRIIYQRRSVNVVVTRDGLLVGINERVGWVDPNDINLIDGEIVGINGDVYDTTERFIPADGVSYLVYITDNDGNPSNAVACTPRADTEFGFIAVGLSGAYIADSDQQAGSRYFIGSADDHLANDFLVTKRVPQADGSVTLELAEYVPVIYEND